MRGADNPETYYMDIKYRETNRERDEGMETKRKRKEKEASKVSGPFFRGRHRSSKIGQAREIYSAPDQLPHRDPDLPSGDYSGAIWLLYR